MVNFIREMFASRARNMQRWTVRSTLAHKFADYREFAAGRNVTGLHRPIMWRQAQHSQVIVPPIDLVVDV